MTSPGAARSADTARSMAISDCACPLTCPTAPWVPGAGSDNRRRWRTSNPLAIVDCIGDGPVVALSIRVSTTGIRPLAIGRQGIVVKVDAHLIVLIYRRVVGVVDGQVEVAGVVHGVQGDGKLWRLRRLLRAVNCRLCCRPSVRISAPAASALLATPPPAGWQRQRP